MNRLKEKGLRQRSMSIKGRNLSKAMSTHMASILPFTGICVIALTWLGNLSRKCSFHKLLLLS